MNININLTDVLAEAAKTPEGAYLLILAAMQARKDHGAALVAGPWKPDNYTAKAASSISRPGIRPWNSDGSHAIARIIDTAHTVQWTIDAYDLNGVRQKTASGLADTVNRAKLLVDSQLRLMGVVLLDD